MWELEYEEGWALKNWCFWTVVLEKTLESPLNCKEIQPIHSEGDQPWDFFGRNDAKAETLVLWPPHVKSWLIGKYFDAERDWASAFSKTSLNIRKFTVHVLLKPGLENFEHYFTNKVPLVKAMVFPVVMYGCESWNMKKAEGQRIDAFELWC